MKSMKLPLIYHFLLFFAIIFVNLGFLRGQSPTEPIKIQVKGVYSDGKIYLRWIPTNYAIWQQGNLHGYGIVRHTVSIDGEWLDAAAMMKSEKIYEGPFLPLTEDNWEQVSVGNDIAAVAAGAIYSEDFQMVPGSGGVDELYEAHATTEKNDNRFGFGLFSADQSFQVAEWMGLGFVDEDFETTQRPVFSYQVFQFPADLKSQEGEIKGAAFVSYGVDYAPPAPQNLAVIENTGTVLLNLPRGDLETHYSSFIIERKDNKNTNWKQRNDKALLYLADNEESPNMLFTDTLEDVNLEYTYRMRGKSPFDILGPASNEVTAKSKPKPLGFAPFLDKVLEVAGAKMSISWTFPDSLNTKINGFDVYRSTESDAGFVKISGVIGVTKRAFTDPSPNPLTNYYKVVAVDNHNLPNESQAKVAQLNDITPPAKPTGLAASVDDNGLVSLTWDKNLELDLKGYRVFYSNFQVGDYAQITEEVSDKTTLKYQLELQVLTKKIYFKILATDFRENDSPACNPILVNRPDKMAPAKPLLSKVDAAGNGIVIEWKPSTSEDILNHQLQRKKTNEINWETLKTIPAASTQTSFLDTSKLGAGMFTYRLLAKDDAGNATSSTAIDVKPIKISLDTIANFNVTSSVDGSDKQAKILWEYMVTDNAVLEFELYRGLGTGAPHLYYTYKIKPDDLVTDPVTGRAIFIYRDPEIQTNTKYNYKVAAKYLDGSSSPFSKVVKFQF
jgi:uncharacterized protein